jgi:IS30 family transposase
MHSESLIEKLTSDFIIIFLFLIFLFQIDDILNIDASRKEFILKNKHLTKEMRERIDNGIREGSSLSYIANAIGKDPTTISKEIIKHRKGIVIERCFITPLPCTQCSKMQDCQVIKVCALKGCSNKCRYCKRVDATAICRSFVKLRCKRLGRFPFVCNGCSRRKACRLAKYEYVPQLAQMEYQKALSASRKGLNLTGEEFRLIDEALKTGTEKGQSINHIIAHNPHLNILIKTGYIYIHSGNFQVKRDDLPNYANNILKKRRNIPKEYEYLENRAMNRKGREYYDYLLYVDTNNITYHTELDCVGIIKDYAGALLSIIIPAWSFLLLYKLPIKDMAHVKEDIDFVYQAMGFEKFNKYLGVLLTDRGPEFNDYLGLEFDGDGVRRTRLFYCDSGSSTQKPFVERINREIRRYVFKGQSVENVTQEDCNLIASNINSMVLDSLGRKTPYEFAKTYLGEEALKRLNIKHIKPADLTIKNIDMIKHEIKNPNRKQLLGFILGSI